MSVNEEWKTLLIDIIYSDIVLLITYIDVFQLRAAVIRSNLNHHFPLPAPGLVFLYCVPEKLQLSSPFSFLSSFLAGALEVVDWPAPRLKPLDSADCCLAGAPEFLNPNPELLLLLLVVGAD